MNNTLMRGNLYTYIYICLFYAFFLDFFAVNLCASERVKFMAGSLSICQHYTSIDTLTKHIVVDCSLKFIYGTYIHFIF